MVQDGPREAPVTMASLPSRERLECDCAMFVVLIRVVERKKWCCYFVSIGLANIGTLLTRVTPLALLPRSTCELQSRDPPSNLIITTTTSNNNNNNTNTSLPDKHPRATFPLPLPSPNGPQTSRQRHPGRRLLDRHNNKQSTLSETWRCQTIQHRQQQ